MNPSRKPGTRTVAATDFLSGRMFSPCASTNNCQLCQGARRSGTYESLTMLCRNLGRRERIHSSDCKRATAWASREAVMDLDVSENVITSSAGYRELPGLRNAEPCSVSSDRPDLRICTLVPQQSEMRKQVRNPHPLLLTTTRRQAQPLPSSPDRDTGPFLP